MASAFPDRSKASIRAKLAKNAGQYLRASKNEPWEEAKTGTKLAIGEEPPNTVSGPCGYIVWEWDGSNYVVESTHCKAGCNCDTTPPTDTTGPMPVGALFTKPC